MAKVKAHLRIQAAAITAVCALALAACGSSDTKGEAGAGKAPPLVFGVGPTLSASPGFLAADKGYFKEFGADVKFDTGAFPSNKALPLLAKGDYAVVAMAYDAAVFNAIDRGSLINVLSNSAKVAADGESIVSVVVSTQEWDKGLTTPAGLKGKKMGVVAYGGFAEYNSYQALEAGGLKKGDAEFVTMGFPDLGPALLNGSVAAGWCSEPLCTQLVNKGIAKRLEFDANKDQGIFQLFVNADYAKKYPENVSKALAGWLKAAEELNNGGWKDEGNLAIVSKYTKIPVDVLKGVPEVQAPKSSIYTTSKEDLTPSFDLAHAMQDYFRSTDTLTYEKDIDLSTHYQSDLLDGALKILGN